MSSNSEDAPINARLVEDILRQILEYCVLSTATDYRIPKMSLLASIRIASVCPLWRRIATTAPKLWQDVVIGNRHRYDDVMISAILERSAGLPLRLNFIVANSSGFLLQDHGRLFLPHINRCKSLVLQNAYIDELEMIELDRQSEATEGNEDSHGDSEEGNADSTESGADSEDDGEPDSEDTSGAESLAQLAIPFPIHMLSSDSIMEFVAEGITFDNEMEILSLIQALPRLEVLVLKSIDVQTEDFASDIHIQPLTHSRLNRLGIHSESWTGTALGPSILQYLDVPSLMSVTLSWDDLELPLLWTPHVFVNERGHRWKAPLLHQLSITALSFEDLSELGHLLDQFPLLEDLELRDIIIRTPVTTSSVKLGPLLALQAVIISDTLQSEVSSVELFLRLQVPVLTSLSLGASNLIVKTPDETGQWTTLHRLSIFGALFDSSILCCLAAVPQLSELRIYGSETERVTDHLWLFSTRHNYIMDLQSLELYELPAISPHPLESFIRGRTHQRKFRRLSVNFCPRIGPSFLGSLGDVVSDISVTQSLT